MDIVQRLLARADDSDNQELDREAAAEIERLRDALREARMYLEGIGNHPEPGEAIDAIDRALAAEQREPT